jgi:hypothetical protein
VRACSSVRDLTRACGRRVGATIMASSECECWVIEASLLNTLLALEPLVRVCMRACVRDGVRVRDSSGIASTRRWRTSWRGEWSVGGGRHSGERSACAWSMQRACDTCASLQSCHTTASRVMSLPARVSLRSRRRRQRTPTRTSALRCASV